MAPSLLRYPNFLASKLESNKKLRGAVDSAVGVVADMLLVSKLPFFPDYTGHGAEHLTSVLETAEKLIADSARELFSAEDAAVLIFSVLMHDLALHLSEAGFKSLLNLEKEESKSTWS
jgi:molecular chaperone HtpG